jgi:transposase-like protein
VAADRGVGADLEVEELLVERGVEVDHVTVYRWVQRFTPLLADAARFTRHSPGGRWYVDETYVKVNGGSTDPTMQQRPAESL